MEPEPLIPKHGGYRKLKSFQIAQLCYDVRVRFCDRFKFYGKKFRLAYFKPAHGANYEVLELFGKNRLTVTR